MYTTRKDVRHPTHPAAENHRFSSAKNLCPFFTPTTKRWYPSGEGGSEPSSNPYHSRCDSCRPTTTTATVYGREDDLARVREVLHQILGS